MFLLPPLGGEKIKKEPFLVLPLPPAGGEGWGEGGRQEPFLYLILIRIQMVLG